MFLSNFTITNKMLRITSEVSILAMAAIFLASPTLQTPQDPPAVPALPGQHRLWHLCRTLYFLYVAPFSIWNIYSRVA